jgi:lipoyl(octanoyl) transferase
MASISGSRVPAGEFGGLPAPAVIDMGRMAYAPAYAEQCRHLEEVLAARQAGQPHIGRILLVEHDPPVITVSKRPGARSNLLAPETRLRELGVTVAETDRGGDITYHGPGQLVVYPILDLNALHLGLHEYMRLLEGAVIDACGALGVAAHRDPCATGVWVGGDPSYQNCGGFRDPAAGGAKICAMGVRVRRWVTMHGLALNVTTNLDHFGLIVPCGLVRPVTSLQRELGDRCPSMDQVKRAVVGALEARIAEAAAQARAEADARA